MQRTHYMVDIHEARTVTEIKLSQKARIVFAKKDKSSGFSTLFSTLHHEETDLNFPFPIGHPGEWRSLLLTATIGSWGTLSFGVTMSDGTETSLHESSTFLLSSQEILFVLTHLHLIMTDGVTSERVEAGKMEAHTHMIHSYPPDLASLRELMFCFWM